VTAPTPPPVRKMGPGVLSVGSVGSPIDFSKRVTSVRVAWSVDAEDDTPVLSGDVEPGDRTYTATLEASVYQDDLRDGELIEFTWANKGTQQPATFTPFSGGKSITGEVIVDPIDVGGDINIKNQSDIKWAFVGEPELVDDLS
jgi:hypothetical protein